jgi:enoyl-CoA hydratase/carnithine racemase
MAMPFPTIDPDDPRWRGLTWDKVEKNLNQQDATLLALAGMDGDFEEERGPSFTNPCHPQYSTFPWEEKVAPFEKKASCGAKDWKYKCLSYKIGKQCATLTFTKGDKSNTFDPEMLDALQDAVTDLQGQTSVRVVIIKSEGKVFSNGFDAKFMQSETNLTEKEITTVQLQFAKTLYFLSRLPQFTVALVQGSVLSAAVGLVCACDMVVSKKGAFFAMSETKLGTVPTVSIPYITRRITYIKNVFQLVLAGAALSAETAKEYGIVNEIVEDDKALEEFADKICKNMTLCAPGAVAATKEVIMNTVGTPPSSFMLNYVSSIVGEVTAGPEKKAGIESLKNKKKPIWGEVPIAA